MTTLPQILLLAAALAPAALCAQVVIPPPTVALSYGSDAFVAPEGGTAAAVLSGNATSGTPGTGVNYTTPFTGFTSTASRITYTSDSVSADYTLSLWLKNPGNNTANNIFVNGSTGTSNRPLQVWVGADNIEGHEGERQVFVGFHGYTGSSILSFNSDYIEWKADTWYQLALVFNNNSPSSKDSITVYLTEKGATTIGTPIINVTTDVSRSSTNTATWAFGGVAQGYYGAIEPSGYFGGQIDDIKLWKGVLLSADQLSANLATAPVPEPATAALLLGGVLLLGATLLRRTRR
ncbi:PEP-CTERM sorting domain-containing protein [Geminisphaera colitermitum]|uniref:PEP-CTERM sorting domain-containing protein n=1 Tax=Geminisphaera colitermitum TaxID=1148786 RepID=UPI000158DF0C|nr:PEP-CTERM sorting domain-containing protein [Geminisphaera colitermitum]